MKKSSVSRMQRLRILRFCILSWKDESEPNIKFCFGNDSRNGSKIHYNTEHWTQSDGEPMEFEWNIFPGFSALELVREVPKVHEQYGRTQKIPRTNYLHVDVQWHHMVKYRQWKRNVLLIPHLCLFSQKDFQQDVGHSLDLVRNKVVFHWQRKTRRKMRSRRWIDDDQIRRKRTPSFPSNESVASRNAQKKRRWKIIYTLLCRWWYDWNCCSHNHFCQSAQYLRSSLRFVWKVQYLSNTHAETCWGRAIRPIFRANWLIDDDTQHPRLRFLHKKIFCRSTKNEWKTFHNKINW